MSEEAQSQPDYEEKYKRALADYINLERRTAADINNGINRAVDYMMIEFLDVYDDFVRARDAYRGQGVDTAGLDSVLRNADSFLKRQQVSAIKSLDEPFDPSLHDAVATVADESIEEQTITKEIRKGYMVQDRVLRPALVEISAKKGA